MNKRPRVKQWAELLESYSPSWLPRNNTWLLCFQFRSKASFEADVGSVLNNVGALEPAVLDSSP